MTKATPWLHAWTGLVLLVACGSGELSAPTPPRVALVTLDTWRQDHFTAEHTPHLWALAQRGERFDNAWSPIGLTSPSHATMFTGALPWVHGMEANNHHGSVLADAHETVAEAFAARGWATAAFVSAYPAGPAGGLDQGFSVFSAPEDGERGGGIAVQQALDWLSIDQPAFVWVHLYEPHGPYEGDGPDDVSRYAEEVRRADALVAPLLEHLEDVGARVVVAGDHGEVLLEERCGRQHERSTHEVVLRVPLFVWEPGRAPKVHTRRIGLDAVRGLLEGVEEPALPTPAAWVAESGLCEPGCAPGCRPAGVRGRDRVAIDEGGRWVRRPGRGTFAEGAPAAATRALLDAVPPMAAPQAEPDLPSLEALGYQAP